MIQDKDIVFVTTTLYTKWLDYQSKIIKNLFPNSEHIIIDGKNRWPLSWFYWIDEVKKSNAKYYIHLDEDFFILNKNEIIRVLNKMESENIDLIGCPDGYHQYRGANPVAINTMIMFGRVEDLNKIDVDFKNINFWWASNGWNNSFNLHYKDYYSDDFQYSFTKIPASNFKTEQEPYYAFLWKMKDLGCKFDYLYPYFDERFKSTNPRFNEDSIDIGIHMWYTREWNSNSDVHGMPNIQRYNLVEKYIKDLYGL